MKTAFRYGTSIWRNDLTSKMTRRSFTQSKHIIKDDKRLEDNEKLSSGTDSYEGHHAPKIHDFTEPRPLAGQQYNISGDLRDARARRTIDHHAGSPDPGRRYLEKNVNESWWDSVLENPIDWRVNDISKPQESFPDLDGIIDASLATETEPEDQQLLSMPNTEAEAPLPLRSSAEGHNTPDHSTHMRSVEEGWPDESASLRRSQSSRPSTNTVFVLGSAPMGKFISHCLSRLPDPPTVKLLLHHQSLVRQWHEEGAAIHLQYNGKLDVNENIQVETPTNIDGFRDTNSHNKLGLSQDDVIDQLIVTTEGWVTIRALSQIAHRLRQSSTICFIQDGLGIVDEVNTKLFPIAWQRPNYVLASLSHLLHSSIERRFAVIEESPGKLAFTALPRSNPRSGAVNSREDGPPIRLTTRWSTNNSSLLYLMRVLSRVPEFNATGYDYETFMKSHLEKFAVASIIGPISVVFDCKNNELLYSYDITRSMKLLIREVSQIILSLPEVQKLHKAEQTFGTARIETLVNSTIAKTGANNTKMLNQVRNGEDTDIDRYNGYLILRAHELDIPCPYNEMFVSIVKGKHSLTRKLLQPIPIMR